ncbi:hypothetical protein VNO77_08307 [Canavalia gladiata]|uniref:Uncharacterized protein n=1 Tax=Canavalia gladiata TaxID=3824 RepID=A0AAN9M961_CANGL
MPSPGCRALQSIITFYPNNLQDPTLTCYFYKVMYKFKFLTHSKRDTEFIIMLLTGGPGSQFWHSAKHINVPNLSTLDLVLHKGKLRGWTTTESQPWCHLPDFTKTCKNSYKCMSCTRIRNHPGLVHLRGVIAVSGSSPYSLGVVISAIKFYGFQVSNGSISSSIWLSFSFVPTRDALSHILPNSQALTSTEPQACEWIGDRTLPQYRVSCPNQILWRYQSSLPEIMDRLPMKVPLETQLRLISSLPDAELFPHSKRSSFLEKDDDVIPDFLRDQCRLQGSE